MNQSDNQELIIMRNVLFLAKSSKKANESQRNLLNKWFQDSVKGYILETIASPLVIEHLKCSSSAEVKLLIYQQAEQDRPKYMAIIEQYFIQIEKCNKQDIFVQKLKQILLNPIDITQGNAGNFNYNTQKKIRKQFVCYLILKYFEVYNKQQMPSFYELWNFCFPQAIQKKKKLSKFDRKVESKDSDSNKKKQQKEPKIVQQTIPSCDSPSSFLNTQDTSNQVDYSQISSQLQDNYYQPHLEQNNYFGYKDASYINYNQVGFNNNALKEQLLEQDTIDDFFIFNNVQTFDQQYDPFTRQQQDQYKGTLVCLGYYDYPNQQYD